MTLQLYKLRQTFPRDGLSDPIASLTSALREIDGLIAPRSRIAIGVGSRGIAGLASMVRELAAYVRRCGAEPFIVPAMGSHGGATAEGQREVLRLYGVSDDAIGAPIRATMEAVELPQGDLPMKIFMDRLAYESDGVLLINRIKPHTDYHGRYESGLMKMALIGLGKLHGATAVHHYGLHGLRELIDPGARRVLAQGKIIAGIGVVENAYHAPLRVEVLKAADIPAREPELLALAKQHMPRLPVPRIDVLVVDRMGKDISGVGIDPNITGRIGVNGQHDPAGPQITAMMVCDLTEQSHGNAIGVGLADVITRRLYDKIDLGITYGNVITSSFLERGKIPVFADTDRGAFELALRSCGGVDAERARIIRIRDTLNLEEIYASKTALEDIGPDPRIERVASANDLFDADGKLTPF
jgi:hypothetical protein